MHFQFKKTNADFKTQPLLAKYILLLSVLQRYHCNLLMYCVLNITFLVFFFIILSNSDKQD